MLYYKVFNYLLFVIIFVPGKIGGNHREVGPIDSALKQKKIQYIYRLAECTQSNPVQATNIHLVDSINVHSNLKQCSVFFSEVTIL